MSLSTPKARDSSLESDRRHLLDASRPASIMSAVTQETIVVVDDDDDGASMRSRVTFSAAAPTVHVLSGSAPPATAAAVAYRGFASRDAYVAALEEFAREKGHFRVEKPTIGFYGEKTMAEYMRDKDRAKLEARERAQRERRASVRDASLRDAASRGDGGEGDGDGDGAKSRRQSTRRPSWAILGRRTSRGA